MRKLYDLEPHEVSLVPRGANKKKFIVYKSSEGKPMTKEEIKTMVNSVDAKTMARIEKAMKGMTKKAFQAEENKDPAMLHKEGVGSDMMPKPDSHAFKDGEHGALSERAQAALKATARILAPHKDELSHEHIQAVAHELGMGPSDVHGEQHLDPSHDKAMKERDLPYEVKEEHKVEALEKAKMAYGEHLAKLGYRKYPDVQPKVGTYKNKMEPDEEDDVEKIRKMDLSAFSDKQKAVVESIFKSHEELVKKNLDLEKELKAEKDKVLKKEFADRARNLRHLGTNSEELATVMKELSEKAPEAYEKVESILKAADSQLEKGKLFSEIGSRLPAGAGSDEAKLDAMVKSIVEKSGGKESYEQVYDRVIQTKEGKELLAKSIEKSQNGKRS